MTGTRIRWEPTSRGGFVGFVGTLDPWAFQIFKTVLGYTGWSLTAQLPGSLGEAGYGDDPDDLKAEAERWLEQFVSSLGALFGDAVAADLRSRAEELAAMVDRRPGAERDKLQFAAGLKRAADLIEYGDQPRRSALT